MNDTVIPRLKISDVFSPYLGPRFKYMGDFSGEEFREQVLIKWLDDNKDAERLEIDLDGASSYPPSFLEEAFGGAKRKGYAEDLNKITFICSDEPELIEEIEYYINQAVFIN